MKKLFIIASVALVLSSCETLEKTQEAGCPQKVCTEEFRSVSVKFLDSKGQSVQVRNYTSINKRTNTSMLKGIVPPVVNPEGIALVASDANLTDISEAGDSIIVTAISPVSNNAVRAGFFIQGGKCACHINKVSGPSELVVN